MSESQQEEVVSSSSEAERYVSIHERRNLEYQRELSKLVPGSAPFKALKKSMRAGKVLLQPIPCWPASRATGARRERG
jgi:hypothetical protein